MSFLPSGKDDMPLSFESMDDARNFDPKQAMKELMDKRQLCSPGSPMPKGARGRWEHTNAHEVECGSDYYTRYKCSDCGHEWTEELPE